MAQTVSLGAIARAKGGELLARRSITPAQTKVLRSIADCRTEALGGHRDRCDRCGHEHTFWNSCRDRHCPGCGAEARGHGVPRSLSPARRSASFCARPPLRLPIQPRSRGQHRQSPRAHRLVAQTPPAYAPSRRPPVSTMQTGNATPSLAHRPSTTTDLVRLVMTRNAAGSPAVLNSEPVLHKLRLHRREHSDISAFATPRAASSPRFSRSSPESGRYLEGLRAQCDPLPEPRGPILPHVGTLLRPTKLFPAS